MTEVSNAAWLPFPWKRSAITTDREGDRRVHTTPVSSVPRNLRFRNLTKNRRGFTIVPLLAFGGVPETTPLEIEFRELAQRWKEETACLSSLTQITAHPAFCRIIGMGRAAIGLVLSEMRKERAWWFPALEAMSGGEDPVSAEQFGNMEAMTSAWLDWGRLRGYI